MQYFDDLGKTKNGLRSVFDTQTATDSCSSGLVVIY